jgi:hypothetical protein
MLQAKKSISDSLTGLGHHTSNAEVSSEAVELLLHYKLTNYVELSTTREATR